MWWMSLIQMGMSLWGGKKAEEAAKQAGEDEATAHEFNAKMSELEAVSIERNSLDIQGIMAREGVEGLSAVKAAQGKAGISGSSVSAFEVKLEFARRTAENIDRFRTDMENKAIKFRNMAKLHRRNAEIAIRGGKAVGEARWSQSMSDAAGYGSQAYSDYRRSRNPMTNSFNA